MFRKVTITSIGRRAGKQFAAMFPLKMNEHGRHIKTFIIDNLSYEKAEELAKDYLKSRIFETGYYYESHQIHNSGNFIGKFKIKAIGLMKEDYYAKKQATSKES